MNTYLYKEISGVQSITKMPKGQILYIRNYNQSELSVADQTGCIKIFIIGIDFK